MMEILAAFLRALADLDEQRRVLRSHPNPSDVLDGTHRQMLAGKIEHWRRLFHKHAFET